jgi:fructose-1,6-bisphosphatase/inositol monophosphatase family enzyme
MDMHGAVARGARLGLQLIPSIGVDCNPFREPEILTPKFASYRHLIERPVNQDGGKLAHGLRIVGSGALSMAYVAKGALDVYWENGLSARSVRDSACHRLLCRRDVSACHERTG